MSQSQTMVKNLLDTNNDERRAFISSFDSVVADCDGNI